MSRLLGVGGVICAAMVTAQAAATQLAGFQGGTGGWQLGTLGVGDIAGDAQLEIVVPYRDDSGNWKLDAFDWHGARLNGFPFVGGSNPINVSPTLYDLDGDGKAEVFFTSGPNVVCLNGNGSVRWTHPVSFLNYVPDSGFMAVTNGFYMSPLGIFQSLLPASAQFFSEVSPPIIADLAGNGGLELLTAWKIKPDALLGTQDYNPFINDYFGGTEWGLSGETWSGGVLAVDARTGARTLTYHFHQLVESGLAVGQGDGDAAREVYVLNDADGVAAFDRTRPHGFYGKGMLHRMFGKNQRLLSGSYLRGVDVYAADIDADGLDEVLVASSQIDPNWQPSETLLDDDGAIVWRKWLQPTTFPTTHGWFNSACMIPVNPDHDGQVDVLSFTQSTQIAFRTWNGVELVDRPGWPKDFAPRLPTPPVVGDIDGDGEEEIIIGTYDPAADPSTGSLYIYALDGTAKLVMPVPGGLKHIPSIADVNNDGSVDLVYRALDGRVYVQNFGAKPNARVSWATHRGNARRDGNMGVDLFPSGVAKVVRPSSNNLIANGGFEENDNSHWDKWFTGEVPWDRMSTTTNNPAFGNQCMEIRLLNDGSQSSISQYTHYGIPESYIKTTPGTLYSFGGYMRGGGLSAASEHWLEWDSAPTGENPNSRPPLPWPDYFTPSLQWSANATSAWTYLSRVFVMPDGFPNVELRHRFNVTGSASGSVFLDNLFFRPLPAPSDSHWSEAISFGATWQFTTNAPANNSWTTQAVNWPQAAAKFGAGTGPQNIRTALPARKSAYYFRKDFNLASTNLSELLLAATCTDDYAGTVYPLRLFLNGVQIDHVEAVTGEGNIVKYFDLSPFITRLRVGSNTLGAVLGNTWAVDWDNVAFDVALKTFARASLVQPQFISALRTGPNSVLLKMQASANTVWRLEASNDFKRWTVIATPTFGSAPVSFEDKGAGSGARVYRLRSLE